MKELPDIKQLNAEAKDALIVALWEEVQKLRLQLVLSGINKAVFQLHNGLPL